MQKPAEMWHKHLHRQIKRLLGQNAEIPENLMPLLDAISEYYTHSDNDRKLLERILEKSSGEMFELNEQLRNDLARKKIIEAELLSSKHRYQSFITHSTEGIWCFENPEPIPTTLPVKEQLKIMFGATLTECNEEMAKMYGYSHPGEIIGKKLHEFLPTGPESEAYLTRFIQANYNISGLDSKEYDRFGKVKYFSNSLTGIIQNTMLTSVWGMQRDITDWKLAQEKIIMSEARLKASQRVAQIGSWEIDITNLDDWSANEVYWSDETYRIFGIEPGKVEINSTQFFSLVHPDDLPKVIKALEHFIKTGETYIVEYRAVLYDGTVKTIHEIAVLEYDPETHKPIKILGTAQDITERKSIQEKMLVSETHLKASQRLAKIGSWEQSLTNLEDTNANPLQWSDETFRIFGFEPGEVEVTNKLFDSLVHPDDLPKLNDTFKNAINGGQPYSVEFRIVLADGTVKTVVEMGEVQADPVTAKPIRIIGAIQDITEWKLIQDKIVVSETHLKNTQRIAQIGSWEMSLDNLENLSQNTLKWSEETFKIYGFEPGEVEPTNALFLSIVHPEDMDLLVTTFNQSFQNSLPLSVELRVVLKDGVQKVVHTMGEFVYHPSTQRPLKIMGTVQDITDWKTIQEKIQINQSHLNTSQRIAKVGSWMIEFPKGITNIRNYEIDWSDETYRIFGLKPQSVKISPKLFFSMLHPSDLKDIKLTVLTSAKRGFLFKEHRIIAKDGSKKIVLQRAEYQYHPKTGEPIKIMGTTQDITEQKIAEQTLKKAEANVRTLLETSGIAFILLDTDTRILTFNQKANELARREGMPDLTPGANYIDWVYENRKKPVLASIKKVLTEKCILQYEIRYDKQLHRTEDRWLDVRMLPIINDDNVLLGISIALTDITDKKKNEQLLKESNERYIMATKATNDVIWDWDIVNDRFYRSENFGQIFGYPTSTDNMYISNWVNNIHPDDRERIEKSVTDAIHTKGATLWQDEYKFYTASGEIAYVQDKAYILHNDKGMPIRMVGAMRDITAKKLAELEHKKITKDLIQRNKDLEQFAYIVSHNLRAPVANIIGFLQVFNEYELNESEKKEYMQGLAISAHKLDEVIMDLNEILNVKRDINELKETIKFSELVADAAYTLQEIIKKENIQVNTDFTAVNEVITLKSYMASIFYNLISNAIKYRRPDVKTLIEIKSTVENNKIIITFIDNGMGIDLEKKGHQVFGLYKRFHKNVEGKGMGLFMVKTQVETLGGRISIQSQPGQGTQFRIEFEG